MDLQLREKTLLVTAASKGLGLGVARALASEGANVIICSRDEDALKEAVTALGDRGEYVVADVTRVDDIVRLMEHVRETYSALDGMFVNAGGPPPGPFESLSDHDWQAAFGLTLMSAVRLTREALPLLKAAESPSILYNTSISVKEPIDNLLLSNAIRPAVVGMMRTLSREIGPMGIRVNAVCPGWVRTDRVKQLLAKNPSREGEIVAQIPLGRMGTPDEFGAVCAFLLSPVSSYIHGALLLIDGGLYHGMM